MTLKRLKGLKTKISDTGICYVSSYVTHPWTFNHDVPDPATVLTHKLDQSTVLEKGTFQTYSDIPALNTLRYRPFKIITTQENQILHFKRRFQSQVGIDD